ncbi:conjugal transfer protein TraD [Nitrosomonas sp. Is35]|uniref:conjugal transfer protein TraD n=1 Tax=Nitrosomonas sp. Is35 TaxID=3080534 RepID=UPI00294AB58B|nr:conjugal transfer protein TraD [Nitrosomonas sp. Is35]MDV6348857.1 conjugal transfer protein TraD [Nitrosomonas sp. Is35]
MNKPRSDTETDKEILQQKLLDAQVPDFKAQFEPQEAEMLGAFTEDAINEKDALDSAIDLLGADHEHL